jgi:hypothetical protein
VKYIKTSHSCSSVLIIALCLVLTVAEEKARADSDRGRLAAEQVLHRMDYPPELYAGDGERLTKKQRWAIRLHGLRTAALHPEVWAMRRIDRTDNRLLIPIRPYYLRASDDSDFRLTEIAVTFRFTPASEHQMKDSPSLNTPVFDIGFGGAFRMGLPGERPPEDSGYVFRTSPSPMLESGFLYRSHYTSKIIEKLSKYRISAGTSYNAVLKVSDKDAVMSFNNKEVARIVRNDLAGGLVSLIVGWHPIEIESLHVRGYFQRGERREEFEESGLFLLRRAE